jgi:hypothetical protein
MEEKDQGLRRKWGKGDGKTPCSGVEQLSCFMLSEAYISHTKCRTERKKSSLKMAQNAAAADGPRRLRIICCMSGPKRQKVKVVGWRRRRRRRPQASSSALEDERNRVLPVKVSLLPSPLPFAAAVGSSHKQEDQFSLHLARTLAAREEAATALIQVQVSEMLCLRYTFSIPTLHEELTQC